MRVTALRSAVMAVAAMMAVPLASGLAAPESGTESTSPAATIASSPVTKPARILVCGDSISQGREGDFTWRYRLWEWFQKNSEAYASTAATQTAPYRPSYSADGISTADVIYKLYPTIQYVGPFNGTLPAEVDAINVDPTNPQTWGTYHPSVDPLFSPGGGSNHFAVYGRPAWQDIEPLHYQITTHNPDILILHLGFNDIGWWGSNATDLILNVQRLVFNARLARPDIKVLIADVSHRLGVAGREDIEATTNQYNALLDDIAVEWWTEDSPIEVVRVSKVYDCKVSACPAGIDGLHPNALGDFQIARAYTEVLFKKFYYGDAPLEVPPPDTIPGLVLPQAGNGKLVGSHAPYSPVTFLAAGAGLLSFLLVATLKPEWLRLRRGRLGLGGVMKGRYHLLPSR